MRLQKWLLAGVREHRVLDLAADDLLPVGGKIQHRAGADDERRDGYPAFFAGGAAGRLRHHRPQRDPRAIKHAGDLYGEPVRAAVRGDRGPESGEEHGKRHALVRWPHHRRKIECVRGHVQAAAGQHVGDKPGDRGRHVGEFARPPQILAPGPAVPQIDQLDMAHDIQAVVQVSPLDGSHRRVAFQLERPAGGVGVRVLGTLGIIHCPRFPDQPYLGGVIVGRVGHVRL